MTRRALDDDCGVAQALNVVGEWRTLLVLRNLFNGMRTFDALQTHLQISSSVLTARLKTLTEAGVVRRVPAARDGRSVEYRLTEKGLDLYPVLVALMQWGERWAASPDGPRLILTERATGAPVRRMAVTAQDGRALRPQEVQPVLGPGGSDTLRALLAHRRDDPSR